MNLSSENIQLEHKYINIKNKLHNDKSNTNNYKNFKKVQKNYNNLLSDINNDLNESLISDINISEDDYITFNALNNIKHTQKIKSPKNKSPKIKSSKIKSSKIKSSKIKTKKSKKNINYFCNIKQLHSIDENKISSSIYILKKICRSINYIIENNSNSLDILKKDNNFINNNENILINIKNKNITAKYKNKIYFIKNVNYFNININTNEKIDDINVFENDFEILKNEMNANISSIINDKKDYSIKNNLLFLLKYKNIFNEKINSTKNKLKFSLLDNIKKKDINKIIFNFKIYNNKKNSYCYIIKNDIIYYFIIKNITDTEIHILLLQVYYNKNKGTLKYTKIDKN
jgi:hypothetical protein